MTIHPIPAEEVPEVQTHTAWSCSTTVQLDGNIVEVVQAVRLLLWTRKKLGEEIGALRQQLDVVKTELANVQAGEPAGYISEELVRHLLSKVSVVRFPLLVGGPGEGDRYELVTAVKIASGEVREVRVEATG